MQDTIPITASDASEASDGHALPVGTRLADFEITGIIGEGGFGIVYLAFDHALQRTVAIKEYMPAALARRGADHSVTVRLQRDRKTFETGLKSFINEARILAQFDHPALIKVYRFWEQHHTGYMAMRYYEGQTLKSVIRHNPALVTQAWLKGLLTPILEALATLYRVRVLHRDISPDNILVQNNGQAVLLDFGAARQIIGDTNDGMTVILKPGYAPIEQYAGDASMAQGPWTDIYSLSAVVYLAIAKKPPPASVARTIKDPIEWLQSGEHAGFDQEFLCALDQGLAVKPEERPQSIEEFRTLLQLERAAPAPSQPDGAAGPAAPVFAAGIVPAPSNPRGGLARFRGWWIAGALCLLGVGGYVALSPKTGPAAAPAAVAVQAESRTPERVLSSPSSTTMQDAASLKDGSSATAENAAPSHAGINAATRLPVPRSSGIQATGTVQLLIKPWGAVSVDGVAKGVSPPLKELTLIEGRHKIKIMNPNFRSHTVEIEISKNRTGRFEYDFSPLKK